MSGEPLLPFSPCGRCSHWIIPCIGTAIGIVAAFGRGEFLGIYVFLPDRNPVSVADQAVAAIVWTGCFER